MEDVRDFLILHYHRTAGREEPLWRHCQAATIPETLAYKIDQFRRSGRIVLGTDELFRDASWFAVLTGQGLRAEDYNPMLDTASDADNRRHLDAVRQAIDSSVAKLPRLARPAASVG